MCVWRGVLRLFAVILPINDGGSLLLCVRGVERRLPLNRGDAILFRGDLVHAGADAPSGHFGRLHVYLDSERVIHTRDTHDAECSRAPAQGLRQSQRLVKSKQF